MKTISYRVGLFKRGDVYRTHSFEKDLGEGAERHWTFVRWLTDWIEAEIPFTEV